MDDIFNKTKVNNFIHTDKSTNQIISLCFRIITPDLVHEIRIKTPTSQNFETWVLFTISVDLTLIQHLFRIFADFSLLCKFIGINLDPCVTVAGIEG